MATPGVAIVFTTTPAELVDGVPRVARARRFRLADEQLLPHRAAAATHHHVAVYEHDDVDVLVAAANALAPGGDGLLSIYGLIYETTEPSKLAEDAPPRPPADIPDGPPGIFLTLTRPVSEADAAEYNRWYDEHHTRDALHMDGFERARRFQLVQGDAAATAPYLALYELSNVAATPHNRDLQSWLGPLSTVYLGPDAYDKAFTRAFIFEELA